MFPPLVVELFAVGISPNAEPCHRPGCPRRQEQTPHTGHVERPFQSRSPWMGFESPCPDAHSFGNTASDRVRTHFVTRRPRHRLTGAPACPRRPTSAVGGWDRIAGITSSRVRCVPALRRQTTRLARGLLRQASLEHGQATLMASGSTGDVRAGRYSRPFLRLVAGYSGCTPHLKRRRQSLSRQ